jgi:hypothetical protein
MKPQIEASLKGALERGIRFLYRKQLPSGEFPTMRWDKSKAKDASYVKSVFITSFIIHSLKHIGKFVPVDKISQHAINFSLGEMENNGLWRFSGKKSYIHFDIDTTCCVLAALKEWGVEMDYYAIASRLLRYRNAQGIFNTWILDTDPPFEKKDNNIDWVVNANALFFYSLLGKRLPEVEQYLLKVVETETFKQRSPYYDSPFCFIYCLTRAYADSHNIELKPAVAQIKDYLLSIQADDKLHGDMLQSALVTVGLLNCGEGGAKSSQSIEYLLSMQRKDGGWPMGIFFTGGPYLGYHIVYGSEELTTAISLEAISKCAEKHGVRLQK